MGISKPADYPKGLPFPTKRFATQEKAGETALQASLRDSAEEMLILAILSFLLLVWLYRPIYPCGKPFGRKRQTFWVIGKTIYIHFHLVSETENRLSLDRNILQGTFLILRQLVSSFYLLPIAYIVLDSDMQSPAALSQIAQQKRKDHPKDHRFGRAAYQLASLPDPLASDTLQERAR